MVKMDRQFELLRGEMSEIKLHLNTVSRGEHVPEIERDICPINEHAHVVYSTLPFKKLVSGMIIELVYCIFLAKHVPIAWRCFLYY